MVSHLYYETNNWDQIIQLLHLGFGAGPVPVRPSVRHAPGTASPLPAAYKVLGSRTRPPLPLGRSLILSAAGTGFLLQLPPHVNKLGSFLQQGDLRIICNWCCDDALPTPQKRDIFATDAALMHG